MDEKKITERGSEPLDKLLASIEQIYSTGRPSVQGSATNLTDVILFLMESGVDALVAPYVGVSG
jgi:endothelin-converting enzyme